MQRDYNREPAAATGRFEAQDEELLMDLLEEHARLAGWETAWVAYGQTEQPVLQVGISNLGKIKAAVTAELSFLHPEGAEGSFTTAQFAAVVFSEVPEENLPEVMHACMRANQYALVGGFGVMGRTLHYRHNLLLRPDYPFIVCGQMLVDALISLRQTLDITVDGLALIARGVNTLDEVIGQGFLD